MLLSDHGGAHKPSIYETVLLVECLLLCVLALNIWAVLKPSRGKLVLIVCTFIVWLSFVFLNTGIIPTG